VGQFCAIAALAGGSVFSDRQQVGFNEDLLNRASLAST